MNNKDIKAFGKLLSKRHYVLASAHPGSSDRFHVSPARGRVSEYVRKFGDRFALVVWKSADAGDAFFVIPIVRIRAELVPERITRQDASWNVHISKGMFRSSEATDRIVDVSDCHGAEALPQRILTASLALPEQLEEMLAALDELG